jgi:hypothetical protein
MATSYSCLFAFPLLLFLRRARQKIPSALRVWECVLSFTLQHSTVIVSVLIVCSKRAHPIHISTVPYRHVKCLMSPSDENKFHGVCTAHYTKCEKDPARHAFSPVTQKNRNCLYLHLKTQKPGRTSSLIERTNDVESTDNVDRPRYSPYIDNQLRTKMSS